MAGGLVGVREGSSSGMSERGSVGRVMKLVRKGRLEESWGRVFCSLRSVHREIGGGIERWLGRQGRKGGGEREMLDEGEGEGVRTRIEGEREEEIEGA